MTDNPYRRKLGLGLYAILITALLALAVFQLIRLRELWFQSSPEPSISFPTADLEENTDLFIPGSIVISSGASSGKAALLSDQNARFDETYHASMDFLEKMVLEQGVLQPAAKSDLPKDHLCTQMHYSVRLPLTLLTDLGCQREDTEEAWFTQIRFYPSATPAEYARIAFLDAESETVYLLRSDTVYWSDEENRELLTQVRSIAETQEEHYYDASDVFPNIIREPCMIPDASGLRSIFPYAVSRPEYSDSAQAFAVLSHFFDYPENVMITESADAWLFFDDRLTLRCSKTGELDYICTVTSDLKTDLREAYQTAWDFLKEDRELEENQLHLHLTQIQETDRGYLFTWTFSLREYVVEEDREPLTAVVEISGGQVTHYHRQLLLEEPYLHMSRPAGETVASVLDSLGLTSCRRISCVYQIIDQQACLFWKIETDEKTMYYKVR